MVSLSVTFSSSSSSSSAATAVARTMVRAWNTEDGTLQWETPLPNGKYPELPSKMIISSTESSVTILHQGQQFVYSLMNGGINNNQQGSSSTLSNANNMIPISSMYSTNFEQQSTKATLFTACVSNSLSTNSIEIKNNRNTPSHVIELSQPVITSSVQLIVLQHKFYIVGISTDKESIIMNSLTSAGQWKIKNGDTIVALSLVGDTANFGNEFSTNTFLRIDTTQRKVYFARIGLSEVSDPIIECNNGEWIVYHGSSVNYPARDQKVITGGMLTIPITKGSDDVSRSLSTTSLVIAESSIDAGVEFTVIEGNGKVHKGITIDQAVYQQETTTESSPYAIQPITSSMIPLTTYGVATRIYPFQFSRPDHSLGMRIIVTFEDGTSALLQSGKIVWKRMDGEACTVQVLPVDVHSGGQVDNFENTNEASITADPALSFVNRLSHQFEYLQSKIVSFGLAIVTSIKNIANDPVGVITGQRTIKPSPTGSMHPGVGAPLTKLLVLRSRVPWLGYRGIDSCTIADLSSVSTQSGIQGSLIAVFAESGTSPWRIPLPVAMEAQQFAKQGKVIHASSFISRAAPIQMHSPEILVIESTLQNDGITTKVWLSWINADTGAVTSQASYATSSTINQVILSPVVHTVFQRKVYTIVHHDDTAVITCASHDVMTSIKSFGSNYVLSYLIYDVPSYIEGVTGKVFDFSIGHSNIHALQTSIDKENSRTEVSIKRGIHTVELVPVGLQTVWESYLSSPDIRTRILSIAASQNIHHHNVLSSHVDNKLTEQLIDNAQQTTNQGSITSSVLAAKGVQVLPDDSLFIKYSNPHYLVIAVGPTGPSTSLFEKQRNAYIRERHESLRTEPMNYDYDPDIAVHGNVTTYVFDTITGQSLYIRRHSSASGPVSLLVNDNWIINTFWNSRSRRPEIASASMYEGAIGTYDLAPWKLRTAKSLSPNISSYTSLLPVVRHRTFILPVTVKAMTVTQTLYSITSPFLLFVTDNDGILMVDRRLLDPRRPTNEPTEHEKAEGLMMYNPYIPLRHNWIINHGLPSNRLQHVLSTPSSFESTTYIVGIGIDTFVSRIAPAKTYDQLDPEFNFILFIILLVGGGILIVRLGQLTKTKETKEAWK